MSEYFPKPNSFGGRVKVELDLENGTGVDTLKFAKQDDLANLKSDVDKSKYTNLFKQFEKKSKQIRC